MDFLLSNSSHFPWDLLFFSRISFWTSESIISLVILILFSRFSWKYSFFIWFVSIFFLAAGYFEKMHQKLFQNESDDAHICNIWTKIFYLHLINPKVWHCLYIFSKDWRNYNWVKILIIQLSPASGNVFEYFYREIKYKMNQF